jgi:hypothetical protein
MMKNYIIDKTNWKKMLLSDIDDCNILEKKTISIKQNIKTDKLNE